MTAISIVITSGKGGVGKTTTVAGLGAALAVLGKKTLLIDADIGLRNLDVVMGLENRIVFNLVDVVKNQCKPNQAVIRSKKSTNLYLLPASQTDDKDVVNEQEMKDLIANYRDDFDYILIDSPAGIEQGFRNACSGADKAIVVTIPEVPAVRDADRVIGLLMAKDIEISLVINRVNKELMRRGDMLSPDDVVEVLGVEKLGMIPLDNEIIIAANIGEQVVFDKSSKTADYYFKIAKSLVGTDLDGVVYPEKEGVLARIGKKLGFAWAH